MTTVSVTLPADGSAASVSQYNTPITTIVSTINGNLDSTNIASLSGTKITAGTLPVTALDANTSGGYTGSVVAPNTVTYNGNRSYSLIFNTVNLTNILSSGMRIRTTRSVAAPTQCTTLNGTTQYYSKTSPAGMTFTNNYVVSAWIKPTGYTTGVIASRYNGTSGWLVYINASGQLIAHGNNAGSTNYKELISYQSVSLNKWTHIAIKQDMTSTTTTGGTNNYILIDGIEVPAAVNSSGTAPTVLIQAGNLEIGSTNGGTLPFQGKIAQVAIYSASVPEATIVASSTQSLIGAETSLISAYSFNNTISDLNVTNANNLTANGSALATTADSPFGGQSGGTISSTLDYGIIQAVTFSTNTTMIVQVPEGCTIPTTGGVSTVVYSSNKSPYGFPAQLTKWTLTCTVIVQSSQTILSGTNYYRTNGMVIVAPIGEWVFGGDFEINGSSSASTTWDLRSVIVPDTAATIANGAAELTAPDLATRHAYGWSGTFIETIMSVRGSRSIASPTAYSHYVFLNATGTLTGGLRGVVGSQMYAENAYL